MKTFSRPQAVALCLLLLLFLGHTTWFFGSLPAYTTNSLETQIGRIVTAVLGESAASRTSLIMAGDVLLARDVEAKMHSHGNNYPYVGLKELFRNRYVVANFEAAVPQTHIYTKAMAMNFSVAEPFLDNLAAAGFTHFSLANNHSYDYGLSGFDNTRYELERRSFTTFGSPQSLSTTSISYLTINEVPVALIGLYAVETVPDSKDLQALIKQASLGSEFQIAYIHWGEEYQSLHNQSQEQLAHQLIDTGVDLIVGHHPHVVQDIERYKNGLIFYSLGNLIFDQYFSEAVQEGLMLELQFTDDRGHIRLRPVTSVYTPAQPHPMDTAETTTFLQQLAASSDQALASEIKGSLISLAISP